MTNTTNTNTINNSNGEIFNNQPVQPTIGIGLDSCVIPVSIQFVFFYIFHYTFIFFGLVPLSCYSETYYCIKDNLYISFLDYILSFLIFYNQKDQ
jgi:hypothetical protein